MKKCCGLLLLLLIPPLLSASGNGKHCSYYQPEVKNIYWGDLHVHTAYSLDAYAYGTLNTPRDAYYFARGGTIQLPDGSPVRLQRSLNFVAVTDHAEWFDLMHICTHPEQAKLPYCTKLREKMSPHLGREIFQEYVIPTITKEKPTQSPICAADPVHCTNASLSQWQRIQQQANEANDPCQFSAFIGFEWSATPSYSHSHRNLIFANENVTHEAIDYIRYPGLEMLWEQLDRQCRPENKCDVIAIPHNTNMGDGIGFDVETDNDRSLQLRSRYERLIEIHQEKGNSECLAPFDTKEKGDCDFEIRLTKHSRIKSDFSKNEWENMRRTYVRSLLQRGLAAYQHSEMKHLNPLQLGLIGSTDNHAGTPGYVDEEHWQGTVFGFGDLDRNMQRIGFNPGGLVAVWAEQNTRESLFAAMKRREVYGTSGPRIVVKFSAFTDEEPVSCTDIDAHKKADVTMGGEFSKVSHAPQFLISALYDKVPLDKIEIIKGEWKKGELKETRLEIWNREDEGKSICQTWSDTDFDPSAPAFWYPRILEKPTSRWSAVHCEKAARCEDYPEAVQSIQERAWGSPIWYLPINN